MGSFSAKNASEKFSRLGTFKYRHALNSWLNQQIVIYNLCDIAAVYLSLLKTSPIFPFLILQIHNS